MFRRGLVVALESERDLAVVADTGGVDEAVRFAGETTPDVAFVDLSLPVGGAAAVLDGLREVSPTTRAVLLVTSDDEPDEYPAFLAGAVGSLHKDAAIAAAAVAARAVMAGQALFSGSVAARLLADAPPEGAAGALRDDERQVLALVADGSPAPMVAIAARLPEARARNLLRSALVKVQRAAAARGVVPSG